MGSKLLGLCCIGPVVGHSWSLVICSVKSTTSRSSEIGESFNISTVDISHVNCKMCSVSLSCGGRGKTAFNTSNLHNHLQSKHDKKCRELLCKNRKLPASEKQFFPRQLQ